MDNSCLCQQHQHGSSQSRLVVSGAAPRKDEDDRYLNKEESAGILPNLSNSAIRERSPDAVLLSISPPAGKTWAKSTICGRSRQHFLEGCTPADTCRAHKTIAGSTA